MSLEEIVLNKLQDTLGNNYELNLGNAFDRRYTTPASTVNGLVYDINFQAFDENVNKIICVFTMQSADYNVVPYTSYNTQYTLQCWYRLDNLKTDKFGVPVSTLPIDVFSDLETLRTTLSNTTIIFNTTFRGKMTFSNPVKSIAYDNTGTGKMGVYTINGKINISDKAVYGSDRIIKIGITTGETITYYAINGIRNYNIGNEREGSTTQEEDKLRPTIWSESNGNTITFSYDNYTDTSNLAMSLIENIALGVESTDDTFYVPIQIYKGTTKIIEYNANINATLTAQNGESGIEVVQVTLQRKE